MAIAEADELDEETILRSLRKALPVSELEELGLRLGASSVCDELENTPRAYSEAVLALKASTTDSPLVGFVEIRPFDLLLASASQSVRRISPPWAEELASHDKNGDLKRTLRVYFDNNMNGSATGKALGVHTNTVLYRLKKIETLTGIDPRSSSAVLDVITVLSLNGGGQSQNKMSEML